MSYDTTYFSQLKILLYIQKYSTLSLAEKKKMKKKESFANLQILQVLFTNNRVA